MFLWMAYQNVAGGFSRTIHSVQVRVLCQDVTLVAITLIPFSRFFFSSLGWWVHIYRVLQKAFKWSLPLNPIFKTYFEDFRNAKTFLQSRGIYFRTRKWLHFQGNFPEVFFWCKQICIVLQFCQTEINLTITNISRVETHNPIGGYRVMFVQYFSARVVDLLSTFFPNFRPFLRGAFRR